MADLPYTQDDLQVQLVGVNPFSGTATNTANVDSLGNLKVANNTDKSVFGPLVVASRVQQLTADFSETLTNNNISQTVTGTGTVTLANANASIATGTGVTSSAQISSIGTIDYLPGREMYAQYTAAFTTPTSPASSQSTGLYNGTDGLLIGYSGLNFGITTIAGGVSTFVSSSSFNIDTLAGSAESQFTRNGTPEAVNFTFKNIYRIRAGWLGAAPIFFEIMSPDGEWVTFHIVRVPNTSINPVFLEPSLPLTMFVTKTSSDSTNLKITTTSWDAGVVDTAGQTDTNDSGTIAALNSTVTISTESKGTVVADITGTWSGTIQIQGDVGDGTWNSINAVNTNFVADRIITSNATVIIPCAGFTSIRFIATIWSSGSANIAWTATSGIQSVTTQSIGNIASGSSDSGNPVKIGGVYNSTLPSVASGSRVDLQTDSSGRIFVVPISYSYFHPIFTTRVQSATGATGSATTSLSIPISSSGTGNLIAVTVSSSVAATITCTDNLSQTYSTAISGTSGTHTNYIFYKANTASGVTSINITASVGSGLCAVVAEYFGASSTPLDKTSTGTVTGVTAFSSGSTTTTTSAVELLFGSANGTTKNNSTYTAGTNWTSIALSNGFNAAAGQLYAEDQYVSSVGTYAATGSAGANDTIIADIATFALPSAPNLVVLNQPKIIKSSAGVLAGVTVNSIGTGTATATLYDGTPTSGSIIAIISLINSPTAFDYNINFTTGLTIVLNSTTSDITVRYA